MTAANLDQDWAVSFGDYQQWVGRDGFRRDKATLFADPKIAAISYYALGLTGEAGEVADKVKKMVRDHNSELTSDLHAGLVKEMGDTLWYLTALANELGVSMSTVAQTNMDKVADREARGVRHGSGDDR